MPKKFKCIVCELYLGEMEKGKLRWNSVILCSSCWAKISSVGETNKETPEFLKNLFGMFDTNKKG